MFTKTTKDGEIVPMANTAPNKSNDHSKGGSMRGSGGRAMASIVGSDMILDGSVKTEGSLQVDGRVKGNIVASDITIGAGGSVEGEVNAEVICVKGRIKGSIRARKVELESGSHVEGDIIHASLQIQPNAVFEGQVKHSKDPLKPAIAAAPALAAPAPAAPAPVTPTPPPAPST